MPHGLPDYNTQLSASAETGNPSKFYVGRRLPAVFAAAALDPLGVKTVAIDRQAPFKDVERELLQSYLDALLDRVTPYLAPSLLAELAQLADRGSRHNILRQPYLTMTWLNVLALGRRPLETG